MELTPLPILPIYQSTSPSLPNPRIPNIQYLISPDPDIEPHRIYPMPSGSPHAELPLNTRHPERVLLVEFIPTYRQGTQGVKRGRSWLFVAEPLSWR